ncbi:MAG: class I SAM-dependent methyltransferase [bacterium]|nr:class I SAM-dependent methyltransferase [bacterium]
MAKDSIGPQTRCQICNNPKLTLVLSLGHQPVLQEYLTEEKLQEPEVTYPLNLVFCNVCGLSQLDYIIDPKLVFMPHYPYRTGLTQMLVRNFDSLAETMHEAGYYKKGDLVVDIGSNDGTLLQQFKKRGAKVVGIEPTNVAKIANRSGIPTLQHYFNAGTVKDIRKKYGTPRVITATNVFAHINDTQTLLKNIKALMDAKTVFVSESQYLRDMVEKFALDTIYNEHLRYYGLKPMMHLFAQHKMSVVDAERIGSSGGSLRVYVKKGAHPMSARAKKLLAEEKSMGLYDLKTLHSFAQQAHDAKHNLVALLTKLKKTGARIVGITSAGRSNALLGFTKINNTLLDYNAEKKGSPKIGMYTPGTHIPVVDEKRLVQDQPEYAVVLSWHIGDELMKKTRAAGYKGKFVLPLPVARIVR